MNAGHGQGDWPEPHALFLVSFAAVRKFVGKIVFTMLKQMVINDDGHTIHTVSDITTIFRLNSNVLQSDMAIFAGAVESCAQMDISFSRLKT